MLSSKLQPSLRGAASSLLLWAILCLLPVIAHITGLSRLTNCRRSTPCQPSPPQASAEMKPHHGHSGCFSCYQRSFFFHHLMLRKMLVGCSENTPNCRRLTTCHCLKRRSTLFIDVGVIGRCCHWKFIKTSNGMSTNNYSSDGLQGCSRPFRCHFAEDTAHQCGRGRSSRSESRCWNFILDQRAAVAVLHCCHHRCQRTTNLLLQCLPCVFFLHRLVAAGEEEHPASPSLREAPQRAKCFGVLHSLPLDGCLQPFMLRTKKCCRPSVPPGGPRRNQIGPWRRDTLPTAKGSASSMLSPMHCHWDMDMEKWMPGLRKSHDDGISTDSVLDFHWNASLLTAPCLSQHRKSQKGIAPLFVAWRHGDVRRCWLRFDVRLATRVKEKEGEGYVIRPMSLFYRSFAYHHGFVYFICMETSAPGSPGILLYLCHNLHAEQEYHAAFIETIQDTYSNWSEFLGSVRVGLGTCAHCCSTIQAIQMR